MDGSIFIDGENIAKYSLNDLRKKLAIIPQDPVLFAGIVQLVHKSHTHNCFQNMFTHFKGTLRSNLDPFRECDDKALWGVLEDIQLKEAASRMGGLDGAVAEST